YGTTRSRGTASATARASCASATTRIPRTARGARSGRPGARTTRPSRVFSAPPAHEGDPDEIRDPGERRQQSVRVAVVAACDLDRPQNDQPEDEDRPGERRRVHVDHP